MATIDRRRRYTETHCSEGHQLTIENIYRKWDGANNKHYDRCKTCRTDRKRDREYGEGASEWYHLKVVEQEGRCALCRDFYGNDLCLDHNHETGQWRALVCKFCNLMIGWVEKSPERLQQAQIYLKNNNLERVD